MCDRFKNGMYEIVNTWTAQFRQEEYLDLADFLEEVYPDRGDFFLSQFHSACSRGGRLYGIPLIFSPWVIACNVDMIRAAGAKVPQPGWLWEDLLSLVRQLRKVYSADQTLSLWPLSSLWVNFLFRSGGAIIVRENGEYEVRLDDPRTLNGFRRIFELQRLLGREKDVLTYNQAKQRFLEGASALFGATREDMNFQSPMNWTCVPLPIVPGGSDRQRQAADLFCVRRQVNNFDEVKAMIRLLLSSEVQERLGRIRYGIPIRRSAAIRSIDEEDPRDSVFFSEMARIAPDCTLAWPELYRMVFRCADRMWEEQLDPAEVLPELAAAMRVFIRYNTPRAAAQKEGECHVEHR